ncbi:MAG: DUF362 domain-containing protein [bacterium]
MSIVSIVKCPDYEQEKVYPAVKKAVELIGGIGQIIKPGKTVLLKINLLSARPPERAVTTHPSLVGAVVRLIKEMGATVWVGEAASTGGMGLERRRGAFDICGIREVVGKEGGEIMNFSLKGYKKIKVPYAKRLEEINLARPILEADVVVSLPKLKTHELTLLTGAVKNFFGCVPSADRFEAHRLSKVEEFSQAVVDIYSVCQPKLAIMDAVVAMEGEGPSAGDPVHLGTVLASPDCVSLDVVASQMTGFKPQEILTSVDAMERGFGPQALEEIRIVGEELKEVRRVSFKKPSAYSSLARRSLRRLLTPLGIKIFRVYPEVDQSRCSQCGLCEEKCPGGAISLDPFPLFNYDKCIQCFTCHELCPEEAIRIKRSWLARQLQKHSL